MRSTVTGTYSSQIFYVHKENKLGIVLDDYKLGNSLNGVATHGCGPDTRSEITKVNSEKTINSG